MQFFSDLHSHFLPGIDDGPSSVAETLQMLKVAYDAGTRSLVATPHMFLDIFKNNDPVAVHAVFQSTIRSLAELAKQEENRFLTQMQLVLGSENYASLEFIQALDNGSVLTLNRSQYLLVEFSPFLPFTSFVNILERVLRRGIFPVIAHAERVHAVQEKPARMASLVNMGCVLQLNGESVVDGAARSTRKAAFALLGDGLAHVIASDGHRPAYRPPVLAEAYRKLADKFGDDRTKMWMWENPQRILKNQPIGRQQ